MELILVILTSVVLLSQFFLDFMIESKRKKIKIGAIILVVGFISLIITYVFQNKEKLHADSKHEKEIYLQQVRFNKLDSINIALNYELKIRNGDLVFIKTQNDSLKLRLMKLQEKQDESLIVSQFSAVEVNKSRVALENMGYKQISRGISEIDKIDMIRLLKINKGSKVEIAAIMGDNEALQFAKQVQEIFEAAGWDVDGISQSLYNNLMQGIFIEIKSEKYPIRVNTIFASFKILNMIAKGNIDNRLGENDVKILIGTK